MQTQITLSDAKARFSEVIERASEGNEIVITRRGKPVAVISRYQPPEAKRRLGILKGRIHISPDFDDWPRDIAESLGMTDQ